MSTILYVGLFLLFYFNAICSEKPAPLRYDGKMFLILFELRRDNPAAVTNVIAHTIITKYQTIMQDVIYAYCSIFTNYFIRINKGL